MHLDSPSLLSEQLFQQAIAPTFLTAHPGMLISDVIALMSQARSTCTLTVSTDGFQDPTIQEIDPSCVLVMDQQRLIGIFTERDVVRLATLDKTWESTTVVEMMTYPVITIPEFATQDIFTALSIFRQHRIRHLPVLNEQGQPVGLLTPTGIRQLLRPIDLLRLRLVSEVMSRQVFQASATTSMMEVAQIMAEHCVSCVVITKHGNAASTSAMPNMPLGIITERDIVQFHALGLDFDIPAHQVMSSPLFCLKPEDSLWDAHQHMQRRHVRRLVVAEEGGNLCGIVTQTSLLSVLNPLEMYSLVDVLQEKIQQLETERITLLQDRNDFLEKQVRERTADLQKQAEYDRLLSRVTVQIHKTLDLQQILQITVSSIQQHLYADRVIVCQFTPGWDAQVVAEAISPGWPSLLQHTIQDPGFASTWVEPYSNGRIHVLTHVQRADLTPNHRDLLHQWQVQAHVVVPIVQSEQLWGLLIAQQCTAPRQWDPFEIEILQKLTTQLAIAIHQSDLHQRTQTELLERQKAEAALQQERNFASAILNAMGALVVVLDHQGRVTQFNQTCEQLTGYQATEICGHFIWEKVLAPEDLDSVRLVFDQLATGRFPNQYENYWITKDGYRRLIAWSNTALTAPDGTVEYIIATGLDVTNQRKTEEALRQSEQRYATLAKIAPVGIFRTDTEGQCLYINDRWSEIAGLSLEAAQGYGWAQGLHPDDREKVSAAWYLATQNSEPFRLEYRFQRADGSVSWVFGQSVAELDANGQIIGYIGTITDISARKRSETALKSIVEGTASVTGQDFFKALVRYITEALGVCHAIVSRRLSNGWLQVLAVWTNGQLQTTLTFDPTLLPCGLALQRGLYCCPRQLQQAFPDQPLLASLEAESYQGVALQNRLGEPIGTLCVLHDQPMEDPAHVEAILRVFAARATAELERQEAIESLEQLNQDLENRVEKRTTALRESEARFRLMADSAPVLLWMTDTTTRYTFFNQSWLDFTGRSLEEELRLGWAAGVHPDDYQQFREVYQSSFAARQSFQMEYRLQRYDGTYRWLLDTGTPRFSPDGSFEGYIGSCIDISDRQQAEVERTRLLDVLEASLNEIYIFDAETLHFKYVNQGALHNLGYTLAEMFQKTPIDLKPEMTEANFYAVIEPLLQYQQEKINFQTMHQRVDGSIYPVDVYLQLIKRSEERLFLAVVADITARRQSEQVLQRQLSAIEAAIDGIAILNPKNQYIYLNPAHLHLFGYETATELSNKTWHDLYSPEEVQRFEQEVFPVLGRDRHWQGEAIATRKDGSTFAEEVSLTLIDDGNLVCVCRDITDRKQAEAQLKASLHEKELLLKEIHHRVKNNLLVVASLLDWQTDYVQDSATRKIFEESQHRIYSMALIHEKLYQSQNLDRIDLGEYLGTLAEHLIHSFDLDPQKVQFHYRLEAIFLNIETATPCGLIVSELISNALEHAFKDGRPGKVWIETRENEAHQIIVSIRDNGVGIPESVDFRRTESLGLQLVCLLTKQIRGTIELLKEQGTEFRLTFSELDYRRRL